MVGDLKQQAWVDAPVIESEAWVENQQNPDLKETGKMPLVVMSHGLNGFRSLLSTFCTQLASEGFIVAAVEHRYIICSVLCVIHLAGTFCKKRVCSYESFLVLNI